MRGPQHGARIAAETFVAQQAANAVLDHDQERTQASDRGAGPETYIRLSARKCCLSRLAQAKYHEMGLAAPEIRGSPPRRRPRLGDRRPTAHAFARKGPLLGRGFAPLRGALAALARTPRRYDPARRQTRLCSHSAPATGPPAGGRSRRRLPPRHVSGAQTRLLSAPPRSGIPFSLLMNGEIPDVAVADFDKRQLGPFNPARSHRQRWSAL